MIRLLISGDFAPMPSPERYGEVSFSALSSLISSCDIHITNLEAPLTGATKRTGKAGPAVKAHPSAVGLLTEAGVDIACLANNHILDFGDAGMRETVSECHANRIETLGLVNGPEDTASYLIRGLKGKRIGLLNYCEHEWSVRKKGLPGAAGYDPVSAYRDITELRTEVDFMVVIYHGGNEYYPLPRPAIRSHFRYLSDIGADAVISHHTHVIGGYEWYKGKPLVYGLGNFFFPAEGEPEEWHYGMVCVLTLGDTAGIELIPVVQCLGNLSVELPEPKTAEACLRRVDELSEIIRDDGMLAAKWREFAEENREWYHKMFLFPTLADRILRKLGFSQNLKARKRGIAGMVRCESLRDLMLESFSEE